jgi:hypothetical protein
MVEIFLNDLDIFRAELPLGRTRRQRTSLANDRVSFNIGQFVKLSKLLVFVGHFSCAI